MILLSLAFLLLYSFMILVIGFLMGSLKTNGLSGNFETTSTNNVRKMFNKMKNRETGAIIKRPQPKPLRDLHEIIKREKYY